MSAAALALSLAAAFASKPQASHLVELFSSEGCSSCPPAEKYLGTLRQDAGLWSTFVPIAWHVDYWNDLGWKDRFSRAEFTARQEAYAHAWGGSSLYTPGFVLDGAEWKKRGPLAPSGRAAGVLSIAADGKGRYKIAFKPAGAAAKAYELHAALLGNGITTKVLKGENAGETLAHEFVALAAASALAQQDTGSFQASVPLAAPSSPTAPRLSVVAWVTEPGATVPLQAVGGDL